MVKVRGSKDGKIINSRFIGQSKSLFPNLKDTKILILLSVIGNEFCTGDYLKSIIKTAISTHQFATFLIADKVYWHNLRRDFSQEEEVAFKRKAVELGADYFERNIEAFLSPLNIVKDKFTEQHHNKTSQQKVKTINELAKIHSNFEIMFWEDWLNKNPSYQEFQFTIMSLFDTEKTLKNSVEEMASNFAKRHETEVKSYELLLKRSQGYLIEESPGVIWVAASLNYHFIAYPGEMIKPFKAAKEFFIKKKSNIYSNKFIILSENPERLINWLEVTFQRSHEDTLLEFKSEATRVNPTVNNLASLQTSLSEIIKGITEGLFALEIEKQEKIKILVDIIEEYQTRNKFSFSTSQEKLLDKDIFNYLIKDYQD